MESNQAQKGKISFHPYRSKVSKIHMSSGPSFVKKQKQRNIYKSAVDECQSGILPQDVTGLTNADQHSYRRLGSKEKMEWEKSGT